LERGIVLTDEGQRDCGGILAVSRSCAKEGGEFQEESIVILLGHAARDELHRCGHFSMLWNWMAVTALYLTNV
jgi:hypothetical protein